MLTLSKVRNLLFVVIPLIASGCAGVTYENGLAYSDGWRKGAVLSIGNGPEYLDRVPERCVSQHPADQFALIRYSDGHLHSRSYTVDNVGAFHSGDKVYFNINTCNLPIDAPRFN